MLRVWALVTLLLAVLMSMTDRTYHTAKQLSRALSEALPHSNDEVEHYRRHGEWDMAITEALGVFAGLRRPLPASLRRNVEARANLPGLFPKMARSMRESLQDIPTE